MTTEFLHYPEFDNPDFYKDIYSKKEFNKTKVSADFLKKTIEEVCDPEQFNLQSHQEFLRNYISSETHYNGLLVFHGVGTGKTCGAIQIAEGLKETVRKLGKKIFIIAKKQVRPNFWKELYSMKREKEEVIPGSKQCTGLTYYIPKSEEKDEARRERKIKSKIKQYYEFFGIQSFANFVDFTVKKEYKNVADYFSDSVIIVDEAHGLTGEAKLKTQSKKKKSGTGASKQKKVSERGILTVLHEILGESTGIKVVLLTATPMKDNEMELVDLINLLLINDKRPMVDKKKLFPSENNIDEQYLGEIVKGYVSYIRGENPVTFPRIGEATPDQLELPEPKMYIPQPIYSEAGELIPTSDKLEHTMLIRCPMSVYQYSNYRKTVTKSGKSSKKSESIDLVGRQASNIIFPVSSNPNTGQYGNEGFRNAFDQYIDPSPPVAYGMTKSGKPLYKKKEVQYKYHDFNEGFLALDQIGKYSKKMETYLTNVINSRGIIYTYSDFVDVGAKLIALILEENGYVRYRPQSKMGASHLLYKKESERIHRCAICGRLNTEDIHKSGKKGYHKFVQATYVLFTGDESKYSKEEIDVVNSEDNIDGQMIKIIVGTRVSGEGIDYKRIREVHIIDPWHNNTRLYQVIGRAARHCSHKDLSESERRVTVFKYCSAPPQLYFDYIDDVNTLMATSQMTKTVPTGGEDGLPITYMDLFTETSDEKVYRRIEKKDVFVKQIERVLKINAVDCKLNKKANIFPHDKDGSRECDYMECDYECAGGVESIDDSTLELNVDTYNLHFAEPQINRAQKIIYDLFRYNFVIDLDNIIRLVLMREPDIEAEYIYEALDLIVGHPPQIPPIVIIDRYNRPGHIIYAKPYYIFQPEDIDDDKAPIYYRMTPLTVKKHFLNLDVLKKETIANLPTIQKQTDSDADAELKINIKATIEDLQTTANKYQTHAKLDRLTPDIQESIYEEVMFNDSYSKEFQKVLIDYFNKLDKLYVYTGLGEPQYLGHKIGMNVRLYEGGQWKTVDESNMMIVEMKATMKAIKVSSATDRPTNQFHGYIKYNQKKKDYEFKLVDYNKQSLKMTKASITKKGVKQSVSKKSKVTGKICRIHKRPELVAYAKSLGITGITSGTKKDTLCDLIELKLRELDDTDTSVRWFFDPVEVLALSIK
jgi:hypothetical protein